MPIEMGVLMFIAGGLCEQVGIIMSEWLSKYHRRLFDDCPGEAWSEVN